jgi:hypothetical protein
MDSVVALTVSFTGVKKAVEKIVIEAKSKLLDDFEIFVKSKVDEESYDSLKELFDEYKDKLSKLAVKIEEEPSNTKTKKGRKAPLKDGEVPAKKALSPYNIFIQEKIREFKLSNPDMKGQELMKKATQAWVQQRNSNNPTP